MKPVIAAGLALMLTLMAPDVGRASPKDESQIRALLEQWRVAYRMKDVAGVMSIYAPGERLVAYDIVPPLQYRGFAAYRKDYQDYFDQYSGALEVEDRAVHVAAAGDIAYAFGLERVAGTLKSGEKSEIWTRFTTVFRKIQGRWYAVHDHISVPTDFATGKAALDLKP